MLRAFFKILTSPKFSREVVEPTTRVWLSQDLGFLNGLFVLAAMKSAASESTLNRGNRILIERLIKLSDANLQLNSLVTKIQRPPFS